MVIMAAAVSLFLFINRIHETGWATVRIVSNLDETISIVNIGVLFLSLYVAFGVRGYFLFDNFKILNDCFTTDKTIYALLYGFTQAIINGVLPDGIDMPLSDCMPLSYFTSLFPSQFILASKILTL